MDRNVANVFHAVGDTVGPCRKYQYRTSHVDIAIHRRVCELAGLSRVSVQTLYALAIKTKATSVDTSVKGKVTKPGSTYNDITE